MKPCDDLRRKFFRWGQVRAYLVLKYVNLTEGEDSFDAHQPLVPADSWGYYWEECKCVFFLLVVAIASWSVCYFFILCGCCWCLLMRGFV